MKIKDFTDLGFSKNEAIVYLNILKKEKSSASTIAFDTKLHRSVVYDNLERLMSKGLVGKVSYSNSKYYFPNDPDMLTKYLETKKKEIQTKIESSKKLKEDIKKSLVLKQPEAIILRGTQSIRMLYKDILTCKSYVAFGAPKASVDIMGDTFWNNIDVKVYESNMSVKLLFNKSLMDFGRKITASFKNIEIKYTDNKFESLTQTILYKNKVAVIVWVESPIITIIDDVRVYKSYKQYFDLLWKVSLD
ncbi:MAG: TrmB family transcriptional regulator [Candidatus Woesearchaeota archaeon]